jgi:hypothetical protein
LAVLQQAGFLSMCVRVEEVLKRLIAFLISHPEDAAAEMGVREVRHLSGLPCASRQQLLREQGVVEMLFDMVTRPFRKFGYGGPLDVASVKQQCPPVYRMCLLVYNVLSRCVHDNRGNQMHAAAWMPVMIGEGQGPAGEEAGRKRTHMCT